MENIRLAIFYHGLENAPTSGNDKLESVSKISVRPFVVDYQSEPGNVRPCTLYQAPKEINEFRYKVIVT